jgi:site-specific DNA-methyltransferase (adenine-specific)
MSEAEYLDRCRTWIARCHDRLAPDGSFWLLVSHEWAWRLTAIAVDEVGFHLRQWLTWFESFGVNCARKFNRCSRPLLWFVKDPDRFVFNADAVTRESDRTAIYGDKRADPGGKLWDDVWGLKPPIPRLVDNAAERLPSFPTQLPVALLRAVVGCASDPGDLVLDPFNGSGTTGVAAIELGRRYVGIEKSEEFARLARMRLSTTKGGIDAA